MKKYLLMVGALLLLPISVNAADAKIEFTSTVKENNNVVVKAKVSSDEAIGSYEYTLDYDEDMLELVDGNPFNSEHSSNNETKSFEREFKFKTKSSGSSKVTATAYSVVGINHKELNVKVNPATIDSTKKESSGLSDNNFLSSLEVEGYKISPAFNKDITSYELTIEKDISDVNIKATAESDKAKVEGVGKHILNDGDNKIKITVLSESKDDRTYTILIHLKEKNPLTVTVNKKTYTVLKNIESVKAPDGYKLSTVRIGGKDVQSLYSDKTDLTLVALKDENDKVSLFIYDSDSESYIPYNVIESEKFAFIPLHTDKKLDGYRVFTEIINDNEVTCFKLYTDSNFCIVYGLNTNTNNKGFYSYDLKDHTLQRYNKDIDKYNKEKLESTKTLIYILSGTTLLFGITTIVFAIKSSKKR